MIGRSLLFTLAFALVGTGCSQDCEGLCEDTKDCKGADKNIDCAAHCEKQKKLNEKAGCEDQYDKYLNCTSGAEDVCRVGDACESETNALSRCLVDYCVDHVDECQ